MQGGGTQRANKSTFFNQKGQLKWVDQLNQNIQSNEQKQNLLKKLLTSSYNLLKSIISPSKNSIKSTSFSQSQQAPSDLQTLFPQQQSYHFSFLKGLNNFEIQNLIQTESDVDPNTAISQKFLKFLQSAQEHCREQKQISMRGIADQEDVKEENNQSNFFQSEIRQHSPKQIQSEQQATIKFELSKDKKLRQRSRSKEIRSIRLADEVLNAKNQTFKNILSQLTKHKNKSKEFIWVREGELKKSTSQVQKRQIVESYNKQDQTMMISMKSHQQCSFEDFDGVFEITKNGLDSSQQQKLL